MDGISSSSSTTTGAFYQQRPSEWKSRSAAAVAATASVLLPHFYAIAGGRDKQQAPSFNGGGGGDGKGVHHSGPLMQLSGKGLLHSGSWKRRYCVLDSQRLFYYPVKESSEAQIQDSEQLPPLCYREKTSHYVDLECYDICEEVAVGKDQRTNVIVLSSTDIENSFFETGRVYLSAETTNEMNEWISQIRSVMTAVRSGGGGTRVANPIKSPQTSQPTTPVKKRPAPAKPIDAIAATVSYSVANNTLISSTTTSTTATGKKKSDAVAVDTMTTLDCNMAKQRAKGPTGRRLPRQVQSRLFPSSHSHSHHLQSSEQNKRSESLPRLEMDQSLQRNGRPQQQQQQAIQRSAVIHNRSLDVVIQQQQQPRRAASTVYAYSSSDDDEGLNVSFMPTSNGDDEGEEEETVETLCEVALPHAVSTPSLAVAGNPFSSWQIIGSSSSTPRPVARAAKQRHNLLRSSANGGTGVIGSASALASARGGGGGSSSTDDPPGLYHLMQQTSAMRATLSSLEADFVSSRRDVGWLQENLSTVQSSAASVSDKVVKMQSQVTGMERQISATVKEAQQLQQRANEALQSAVEAERDFRRLANECQSLLDHLRRGQSSSPAEVVDLSPMTPHPPGMMMIHHYVQQQQQQQQQQKTTHYQQQFNVPAAFDFAALLASTQQQQQPKIIKSSFKTIDSGVSQSKSISFGPTTTYSLSPLASPGGDDDDPPAATSTLKKSLSVANPIQADFNHQNSAHTTKNL